MVRNIPEKVHNALRKLAKIKGMSVEALARNALEEVARAGRSGGIDFDRLQRDRAAFGLTADGPEWTEALDDPAVSRGVLGLEA
jgi:hypothetical protein